MNEPLRFTLNVYGSRGHSNGRGGDGSLYRGGGDFLASVPAEQWPCLRQVDDARAKFIDEVLAKRRQSVETS